jgi:hypothetical protein
VAVPMISGIRIATPLMLDIIRPWSLSVPERGRLFTSANLT